MINLDNIPHHVAIIMDGNGRWAKAKNLNRVAGHKEGAKRVEEIIKAAGNLGIKVLTLYTFSTENWSRPKNEISVLMRLLSNSLRKQLSNMQKNNIRFRVIGRGHPLPKYLLDQIRDVEEKTKQNTGLLLVMALNYGSRQEILDAVKKVITAYNKKEIDQLSPQKFSEYLYTAGIPDPDLLIRTSAEMRMSNFLLWQLSYTELYFLDKFWPDFKEEDLKKAIEVYSKRRRRFGGLDAS